MRWDDVFAELAAEFVAAEREESQAQLSALVAAEVAGTTFADRCRARRGQPLTVRLQDGSTRSGSVRDATRAWVLLAEGDRRSLVPLTAVVLAWPLHGSAPEPGPVEARIGLGHALRALAEQRLPALVCTATGDHRGQILRVGADHLDLAGDAGVLTVPWRALLSVDSF
ncbi:hypothetical protein [Ruania zhangjianzhongii]|uniref:hypothetical protein n=1 Tax=Ruania zhangjianzhongii TaxID=2603206 RepID=UPI0011C82A88|nr:hypothetical protein [Ruania zhangjianzhongii]